MYHLRTTAIFNNGGTGGTNNYPDLENLPQINSVTLVGNKSLHDLGIQAEGEYITTETDPTVPSHVKSITQQDIASWNAKADTTDIPDVSNFITKNVNDLTYYELKANTGNNLLVSINSSTYVMTMQLRNSENVVLSTQTVDLPLEAMVVNAEYDSTTKEIVLTLQSGSTTRFSVADLVSGLQTEITSSNKLSSDLVDDTNATNLFVTSTEKSTWSAKYDKPSGGIPSTDMSSAVQTSLGKADTALQTHQDISGKLDVSKVKSSTSTTSGDVYDVTYINTMLGDIESLLGGI